MPKPVRLLMPIVIAVVLGPLIAGLAFLLFGIVSNLVTHDYPVDFSDADSLKFLLLFIFFAYFEGGPIALLAGLLVSVWMIRRPPSFVIVIVAAVIAIGLFRLAVEIGLFGASGAPLVRHNLKLTLVLGIVAAAGCWLLTRRFARTA
jgi:hypothetical protein